VARDRDDRAFVPPANVTYGAATISIEEACRMNLSADTAPLDVTDMDDAVAVLRARGHRVSAVRRRVLTALFSSDRPLSAEEISVGAGGLVPESEITSVYRNLETLEQLGVVSHVHLGHGPGRYRLAAEHQPYYVVCERCGTVEAADAEAVEAVQSLVRERFGYEARFTHFPIVGTCPACAALAEPTDRPEH
jgi:Fur family ferric uptake transcriptional regulator